MMTVTIKNRPRVYFLYFDQKRLKWKLLTGRRNLRRYVEGQWLYEIQGTRHRYTRVRQADYFGADRGKALVECIVRNAAAGRGEG